MNQRHPLIDPVQRLDQLDAVAVREQVVDDHQIGDVRAERGLGVVRRLRLLYLVAVGPEQRPEHVAEAALVIHDQDPAH